MQTSIIMPAYNAEVYISQSIESVLSQTDPNWELIVTDDCSEDGTRDIVEYYKSKDRRILYFQNTVNGGPAVSRNNSISHASGRFIAFLDSDDRWSPDKLQMQIAFMRANNYAFTYTDYWITDPDGEMLKKRDCPAKINYSSLLKTNYIGCLTAMYDVSELGIQYMPLIRKRQDYGLWLQLLKGTDYAYGLNEPLAYYRVHENSLSSNKVDAAVHTWKLYRNVERLGLIRSSYSFVNYAIRGVLRR